ncbi:hypothetical protein BDR05DRAFT_971307 [Suillus weaverae]|nr:hypothetical protein BDR05DRAFT_971307 [Suillus weaverae]
MHWYRLDHGSAGKPTGSDAMQCPNQLGDTDIDQLTPQFFDDTRGDVHSSTTGGAIFSSLCFIIAFPYSSAALINCDPAHARATI